MDINFRNRFQGESFEYCFNNDTQMGWIKVKTDKDCYVFETKREYFRSKIYKFYVVTFFIHFHDILEAYCLHAYLLNNSTRRQGIFDKNALFV